MLLSKANVMQEKSVRQKKRQNSGMLKEKFGLFVDFEFLTEMGSWCTD